MVWLLFLFYLLLLLSSTAKAQEQAVELLPLHDPTVGLQAPSSLNARQPVAVQVGTGNLKNVSYSVLMAETWVRNYVLPYYPSSNISTIIVGHTVFCNIDQQQPNINKLGLIFPAIKNIHYCLTRWGLQNDIKVTTSLSSDCLNSSSTNSEAYRVDLAENYIKPLLTILQEIGSPYVVNPGPTPNLSDETLSFLESHHKSMKNLGIFHMRKVNVVISSSPRNEKPTSRKLSFIDISKNIVPFPAPAAKIPLPPLVGTISPASNPRSPRFSPHLAPNPMANPAASPPFGHHLPPCEPSGGGGGSVGAPVGGVPVHHDLLWCVAKPSVPAETLQESLDYACGEGGADCEAIKDDNGSCYFPDTVVAHASYAFNSYWQKNKRIGGTCGFGGTAMLINSDPSYRNCRFMFT